MPLDSLPTFTDSLQRLRLLSPSQLNELTTSMSASFPEPRALAGELVKRGWLTPFQVNQLARGQGEQLILGQYLLLDRLGEGGMGTVYKARHLRLDRLVALKVIRQEQVAHGETIKRFQREARAAARLAHPNIVTIHDADEVNGTHFIVMEYVEGSDLGKLVKQQ